MKDTKHGCNSSNPCLQNVNGKVMALRITSLEALMWWEFNLWKLRIAKILILVDDKPMTAIL